MAAVERVHPATVSKWRRRFSADPLEGLADAPRPGAERTVAGETIEAVVVDTLESAPPDATQWSTRGLPAKHGISKTTVAETRTWWRRSGTWPPVHESSRRRGGVRGRRETPDPSARPHPPILHMLSTTPARATHDYQRNGTVDLFAALDVARGTVISDIRVSHNQDDFISFLGKINRGVPDQLAVHVILDNLSTHKTPMVQRWLLRHRRFHLHFTPTPRVLDEPGGTVILRPHHQRS